MPPARLVLLAGADDWTRVVAAHAMAEAALNHRLAGAGEQRPLARVHRALPLGGTRASRLGIADALDLLPDQELRFLRRLDVLRADAVADAAALTFSIGARRDRQPEAARDRFDRECLAPLELLLGRQLEVAAAQLGQAVLIGAAVVLAGARRRDDPHGRADAPSLEALRSAVEACIATIPRAGSG